MARGNTKKKKQISQYGSQNDSWEADIMPLIQKVTDPQKIVNDSYVLSHLSKQGIDKNYVEFFEDYNTLHPYGKVYRDLKSNKRIMVISGLPKVKLDGIKIQPSWLKQGNKYISKPNLFSSVVNGGQVTTTSLEDHSKAKNAGDTLQYHPQLFLSGVEQFSGNASLLAIDPVNPNYTNNTLEWDYGICKRRLRIIEGAILGSWIFDNNPNGEVLIRYNQTGDYRLHLSQFKVSEDDELVGTEDFDTQKSYPLIVSDTDTSYSVADTHILSNAPTSTEGASLSLIFIGDGAGPEAARYRILIKFDISGIDSIAIVSAVTLSMWEVADWDTEGIGTWACKLNRLLQNWVEAQATWNVYSTGNSWGTVGAAGAGDIDGDVSATLTLDVTPASTYVDWTGATLTDDVQKMIDGTYANNYGWRLWAEDAEAQAGSGVCGSQFYARERGNTTNDPKLVVTFTIPSAASAKKSLAGILSDGGFI